MADTVEINQAYTFDGTTYRREMPREVAEKYEVGGVGAGASEDEIDATDAAKELAAEEDVDLASVEGTGSDGRITKGDVQEAAAEE